jgi:hypothetical protein
MFVHTAICKDLIIGAGNVKFLCKSIINMPKNAAGYIVYILN